MNAETVLFLNGRSARYAVHADSHMGEPYVYAANVNGITVRVYLTPGESVLWVERVASAGYRSILEPTLTLAA